MQLKFFLCWKNIYIYVQSKSNSTQFLPMDYSFIYCLNSVSAKSYTIWVQSKPNSTLFLPMDYSFIYLYIYTLCIYISYNIYVESPCILALPFVWTLPEKKRKCQVISRLCNYYWLALCPNRRFTTVTKIIECSNHQQPITILMNKHM